MNFDDWYSANVAPTLPNDIPKKLRQAAREQMARCWNAALEAAEKHSYPIAQLIASRAVAVDELEDMKVKL